ncbi:MAG: class I SAM-dependent methyltransferase, partial [Halobacteriaceae archaeon]
DIMTNEEPVAKDAYDKIADTYVTEVETNPYNEYLDFPGTTSLIPDVSGKRILDAGCGTGKYTEWLVEHDADVVGVDVSEEMLAHANDRVPNEVELHQANLEDPLSFAAENEFDGIVSGLVLGYIKDWQQAFTEFARILQHGGFIVFSVNHPFNEFPLDETESYFEIEKRTKEWDVTVPYYYRPLAKIVNPILNAGFHIDELAEPQPTDEFKAEWPERYEKESRYPVFLAIRAVNQSDATQ